MQKTKFLADEGTNELMEKYVLYWTERTLDKLEKGEEEVNAEQFGEDVVTAWEEYNSTNTGKSRKLKRKLSAGDAKGALPLKRRKMMK